jgi:hypothetical protein
MKYVVLLLFLIPVAALAEELPLFSSDEPLNIVIDVPLATVLQNPEKRPVVEGNASYMDSSGKSVTLPVKVATRGRSRLEVCEFPPLSLNVKKKSAANTFFAGQKSLKIVTHCRSNPQFRNYVLQEYGIYKAFAVLTGVSFRARLLNITYRDTEDKMGEIRERGFLIESIGEVAKRNGLKRQKVRQVSVNQLDPAHSTLAAVFQFLVGNTDWSVKLAPDGADCCHNGRVLGKKNSDDGWKVVPYDFDQSGLINARYAKPARQLGLRSVRQRLFRGRCAHNDQLDAVIELFNDRRSELETALLVEGIRDRRSAASYVASFYQVINDPRLRSKYIEDRCLAN